MFRGLMMGGLATGLDGAALRQALALAAGLEQHGLADARVFAHTVEQYQDPADLLVEILAHAPPLVCDRVHWDTVEEFDARRVLPVIEQELGIAAHTRLWSDGQHRVWVPVGHGYDAREVLRQWCEANEVEAVNMRVETEVPFRDLALIPGSLLPDLIAAAVDWLYPRLHAIRRKLVADLDLLDDDDVRSMMYLFVSDHMDRFDADREGRNGTLTLLAFLIGKLRNWPQDAARQAYGRGVVGDRLFDILTGFA